MSLSGFQIILKFVSIDEIIHKTGNNSTWTHAIQIRFSYNPPKHSNQFLPTILNRMKLPLSETDFPKRLVFSRYYFVFA